jgi:hypothetical protein
VNNKKFWETIIQTIEEQQNVFSYYPSKYDSLFSYISHRLYTKFVLSCGITSNGLSTALTCAPYSDISVITPR